MPASLDSEIVPLGLSADGRTAYVSAWTPRFAGVAALSLATGHLRHIRAFRNPAADQADGSSGGHWLVWVETHSLRSLDGFTVYAWDSVTGQLRRLGHSLRDRHGIPWPSPWHAPAVSGNYAAWAQGYGPDGEVEVMLANLATGKVRVVRRGHTQPPFFDRNLLVWPESDQPGTQTALHAVSLSTGRPAALPAVLRAVHGTDFVVTDGTRTAYLNPGLTALYYSPAPGQPGARRATAAAGGGLRRPGHRAGLTGLGDVPGHLPGQYQDRPLRASDSTIRRRDRIRPGRADLRCAGREGRPPDPAHARAQAGLAWRACRPKA